MNTPALEIVDLVTKYGDKTILDNFSLTISAEEIISLLGPSGCGKTTLLKCISGLENIVSGKIQIFGSTVQTPQKSLPIRKRGIGMVFQDNALFPHLTVLENVIFGIPRTEQKTPETQERILNLLNALHILPLSNKYPHEISGGQQQRTSLARSIAPRPRLILMDEPFNSQDVGLKEQIMESVFQLLQKEKITTLIVTHNQNEAFKISHRIGVMQKYCLEQIGIPKEIYHFPITQFTAGFVGNGSFIQANYSQGKAITNLFSFKGSPPTNIQLKEGEKVWVHLRPENIILSGERTGEKTIFGLITRKEFRSGNYLYQVRMADINFPDEEDPILYSLMPTNFEKNLGDRVTVHVANKPYIFFPTSFRHSDF